MARPVVHRIVLLTVTGAGLALAAPGKWKAPAAADKKFNPHRADERSLSTGRKLYARECAECHGKSGKGDGPGAKDLLEKPPDLAAADLHAQSDGVLFWKLTQGRGEMPSYRKLASEDDRWHLVNFIRTLAPEKTAGGKAGRP